MIIVLLINNKFYIISFDFDYLGKLEMLYNKCEFFYTHHFIFLKEV